MKNEIKCSLINSDSLQNILNDEPLNPNFDDISLNSENETINKNKEKAKELIQKLLKESLDQRILNSEKTARSQLITLKNSNDLAITITNVTLKISKQIQEKIKRDKEMKEKQSKQRQSRLANLKNKKGSSPHKLNASRTTTNFYRSKTPSHVGKNGNNIHSKTPLSKLKKDLSKSKPNLIKRKLSSKNNGLNNKYNIRRKSLGRKTKSSLNFKNYKNMNDYSLDDLATQSVTSIKTNKTNNICVNSKLNYYKNLNRPLKKKNGLRQNLDISKDSKMSSNTKNLNVTNNNINININSSSDKNIIINLGKKKNFISKNNNNYDNSAEKNNRRKKTPFNKRTITETSLSIKKGEKTVEDEIDDILTMEYKLQKENILNDNDPLLVLPMKDLDFVPKGLLKKNISIRNEMRQSRRYKINTFDILENFHRINFDYTIFQFLDISTLISLKNVCSIFHKLVIPYIINVLEKEKKYINEIKSSLGITKIPERDSIENIVLNKLSKKAMRLLNESLLNEFFKNNKIPSDDIILIYRLYFQMINHPYSIIAKSDIGQFWEKCKSYFSSEQNGKTGDILLSMINQKKIDFSKNNEYQIYMLAKGNYKKILPNYFSNICGTTGLFVFVIKDILEFMGITPKIKKKENAFWTYSDIMESIDDKINYLSKI